MQESSEIQSSGSETEGFSDHLHATKYREKNESFEQSMERIAGALCGGDDHRKRFTEILLDRRFLPAGRVQSSIGSQKETTAFNCFVSGKIEDHLVGKGSIMDRATEAARTMKMGGGIGFDFSSLRPGGAPIEKLDSMSSGPISFMGIFNAIGLAISSAGHRRGAMMAVLRVDHPDIEPFIAAKQNEHALTGFNVSVNITDDFVKALDNDTDFDLLWDYEPTKKPVNARNLWDRIMRSTYDYAEPGVLFMDQANRMNNLYYCETMAATNPCSEQCLPPYGACLLGSFNLTRYLTDTDNGRWLNLQRLENDIPVVVKAMDAVTDISRYPLEEQKEEALSKRRMGLGVTGVANALEYLGHKYASPKFLALLKKTMTTLRDCAYTASMELARSKKEPFPMFDRDLYLRGNFVRDLPIHIRRGIAKHGIRNSHLTSIAPTGTISLCAGNVSSGIEPVFAHRMKRKVFFPEGQREVEIVDYGVRKLGVEGKTTSDCTVNDHLNVLKTVVPYVDSAVSKTVNIPSDMPFDDFKEVYRKAHAFGAKGLSTFRIGGERAGIMEDASESESEGDGVSCELDEHGHLSCE